MRTSYAMDFINLPITKIRSLLQYIDGFSEEKILFFANNSGDCCLKYQNHGSVSDETHSHLTNIFQNPYNPESSNVQTSVLS